MSALGLSLAALVGLSLGLLGGGGSILTVPIFVYALGFETKPAIAMSLAVVGTVSLVGALRHWSAGNVQPKVALLFAAAAMPGSFLGARLAAFVSGSVQLMLFAAVMLVAAYFMLRPARLGGTSPEHAQQPMPLAKIGVMGLAVGVLTGLVGVGGGFMIVPALVLLGRVPMKPAVGTSLLVIAMNSAAAFAGYLGRVEIAWAPMALFAAIATGGILAGARLSHRVPAAHLQKAFALFLVAMGGFILYQNRAALLPERPVAQDVVVSEAQTSNEQVIR